MEKVLTERVSWDFSKHHRSWPGMVAEGVTQMNETGLPRVGETGMRTTQAKKCRKYKSKEREGAGTTGEARETFRGKGKRRCGHQADPWGENFQTKARSFLHSNCSNHVCINKQLADAKAMLSN